VEPRQGACCHRSTLSAHEQPDRRRSPPKAIQKQGNEHHKQIFDLICTLQTGIAFSKNRGPIRLTVDTLKIHYSVQKIAVSDILERACLHQSKRSDKTKDPNNFVLGSR
jgi:hypothetical protein